MSRKSLPWLFLAGVAVIFAFWLRPGRDEKPGITIGVDAFVSTLVSPLEGFEQSGVYDSAQGLEIAVLDYGMISFLDPKTYAVKRTVPVNDTRVGYKDLVSLRADGQLNLLAGGGGYSDVGWFDLDEHELWGFRVQGSKLPPNRMICEDLDRDGTKEFYVAAHEGVFRLDPTGQVVWRAAAQGNYYLFTLPEVAGAPAVVTEEGMWDAHGKELQQGIKSSVGTYRLQPVKWRDRHCLAAGETSSQGGHISVFDLTGNVLFRQTIGDWGVGEVLAVRFKVGEPPYLVVTGGRGIRSQMTSFSVFSHEGTLVYQEIGEGATLLVIPDEATGKDTLLRCRGGIHKFEMR